MVKAACHRIIGDHSLAEDLAQETFLLLIRRLPSLSPQRILGGWLYVTACNLARTHLRAQMRRKIRETQPEALDHFMNPNEERVWLELEPLLDDAIQTLSGRQRELVLARYFQNQSQRAAAALLGCSESVASRELSAALERLRKFLSHHGVTVSGAVLASVLSAKAAQASSLPAATLASMLASASAIPAASGVSTSLFLTLMKTTTTTKIIVAASALVITIGTVRFLSRESSSQSRSEQPSTLAAADRTGSETNSSPTGTINSTPVSPPVSRSSSATKPKASPIYSEAAIKLAHEKQVKFWQRLNELFLMDDASKVQQLLADEYGIRVSLEDIRRLKDGNPKRWAEGLCQLWATRQPQDALNWAASIVSDPKGWSLSQGIIEMARRSLPNLSRDTLDGMLPDGPGKDQMLDEAEALTDPASLAKRFLATTDADERSSRLRVLAVAWQDSEAAAAWARQNLSGDERVSFYSQVAYNLARQNQQAALQLLSEMQGTDAYASTFASMMPGLAQEGNFGQQAAELIDQSTLSPKDRADLISMLARMWVRRDPDATIAWVNGLNAPEDFSAAIPLLVSQLDNDRVTRTVEAYLKNPDPTMKAALIDAAAPGGLYFDPEKSRLILDALINNDPNLKIQNQGSADDGKERPLWGPINLTLARMVEVGNPAGALEWISKLPFASQNDYAGALDTVFGIWNVKSPTDAANWVQNSQLDASLKSKLLKSGKP